MCNYWRESLQGGFDTFPPPQEPKSGQYVRIFGQPVSLPQVLLSLNALYAMNTMRYNGYFPGRYLIVVDQDFRIAVGHRNYLNHRDCNCTDCFLEHGVGRW